MLNHRGFTYISLMIIFLMISGMVHAFFSMLINFKEQEKIALNNIEIFSNCLGFSEKMIFLGVGNVNHEENGILYTIKTEQEGSLLKTRVQAFREDNLEEEVLRYKFSPLAIREESE